MYVDGQILVKPGYGKNIASVFRKEILAGPKNQTKSESIPKLLISASEEDYQVETKPATSLIQPANSPSYISEMIAKKNVLEPESPLKLSGLSQFSLSPKMTNQLINTVLNENLVANLNTNRQRKKSTSYLNGWELFWFIFIINYIFYIF